MNKPNAPKKKAQAQPARDLALAALERQSPDLAAWFQGLKQSVSERAER